MPTYGCQQLMQVQPSERSCHARGPWSPTAPNFQHNPVTGGGRTGRGDQVLLGLLEHPSLLSACGWSHRHQSASEGEGPQEWEGSLTRASAGPGGQVLPCGSGVQDPGPSSPALSRLHLRGTPERADTLLTASRSLRGAVSGADASAAGRRGLWGRLRFGAGAGVWGSALTA